MPREIHIRTNFPNITTTRQSKKSNQPALRPRSRGADAWGNYIGQPWQTKLDTNPDFCCMAWVLYEADEDQLEKMGITPEERCRWLANVEADSDPHTDTKWQKWTEMVDELNNLVRQHGFEASAHDAFEELNAAFEELNK